MEDGYGAYRLHTLLSPTVGFDHLASLLAQTLERDEAGFPPYTIEKRVTMHMDRDGGRRIFEG